MSKKVFIVVFIIFIMIIASLIYYIHIITPTEEYVSFENRIKYFFNIADNGNEVVFTKYNSEGKIYSEAIYTFENNSLKNLTRVQYSNSILQAKIDKKYPTDTTAKCYRDKNKLIYTYDNYDLYGSSKDVVLQSLNSIIENSDK